MGLRNPFRFSFDGDNITIGDVGDSAREEVNIVPIDTAKGGDFQWPAPRAQSRDLSRIGKPPSRRSRRSTTTRGRSTRRTASCAGSPLIGGVVVRDQHLQGTALDPDLGAYLFAEAFIAPNSRSFMPTSGRRRSPALRHTRSALTTSPELARTRKSACTSPRWPARCTGSIP